MITTNNKITTLLHFRMGYSKLKGLAVPILAIAIVAGIGSYLLISSHAATPYASVSVDSGTLANGATKQTCSGASDGNCVAFGSSSSGFSLSKVFPIGVDQQPTSNFELWKSRGVNTVLDVPEGNDQSAWDKTALADGLYEMRGPSSNPSSDVGIKNLIAWDQPDEPDGIDSQVPYTTIQSNYNTWKAAGPSLPVYINFTSGLNQYDLDDPSQAALLGTRSMLPELTG